METISVALLCTVISVVISYLSFNKGNKNEIKTNEREKSETMTTLNYIVKGVDDIRLDIKAQQRDIQELRERIVKVESSLSSAHKRMDDMDKK